MFRYLEQLDMGVTHLEHVGDKRLGQLPITEMPISLIVFSSPRTEMHFVNAQRRFRPILFPSRLHPLGVAPCVALEIVNHRRSFLAPLVEERERIALEQKH